MNISTFTTWFIENFIAIATNLINKIDNIYLIENVSLLDFIITLAIIGTFIEIIITIPNLGIVQKHINTKDRIARRKQAMARRSKKNDN